MNYRALSSIGVYRMRVGFQSFHREDGAVLVVALIFLGILALVGATATIITTTDIKIGANYKASEKALYVAEAGVQEARERLRLKPDTDPAFPDIIKDGHANNHEWAAYIGESTKAQKKGYVVGNPVHVYTLSVQTGTDMMDYTVVITHQIDPSDPTKVLYWGDSDGDGDPQRHTDGTKGDPNIYLITSYGNAEGASKVVQMEVMRLKPIDVRAALYAGSPATINGNSTDIIGNDGCGGSPLPGIATPLAMPGAVTTNGGPNITGEGMGDDPDPPSISDLQNPPINVQTLVNSLKVAADFSYTVDSATQTASSTPGPGDGWGDPTPGSTDTDPSSCDEFNIVYYNTQDSYIKLSGGVSGCGILLVEGDLEMHGGFSWYGPILVTGSLDFTGSGDSNITGAVLTGGEAAADVEVGGDTNIVYCSTAIAAMHNRPLSILNWKQRLGE
jgi:hypothetical protein